MVEAAGTSETLEYLDQCTRRYSPEDRHPPRIHRLEDLKFFSVMEDFMVLFR
jgi:hypothetical protein